MRARLWGRGVDELHIPEHYLPTYTLKTWDEEAKREFVAEKKKRAGAVYSEEEVDYRGMVSWERVLSRCTGMRERGFDVHTYPHRLFYGVSERAFDGTRWASPGAGRWWFRPVVPGMPVRGGAGAYLPVSEDVEMVLGYLRFKGLPAELSLQVLEFAGFKVERRLPVANDPLDARNREELVKYLSWCWKVLVWVDVFMREQGMGFSGSMRLRRWRGSYGVVGEEVGRECGGIYVQMRSWRRI
ncbi:uncharacterized protein LY89DRAFT_158268 [Mollisia scopiformis]|uniref:Uncharacterized protein n=1 Tax=Mollisia scopiformis TaxID=149040 RepID=A0A194X0M7_MOLSC|nr:uncharacterized protein LY89DRAFT_158268 [Mollisia scopiformis]KUJ13422.1 hypothetical protein LY89DRAFT_158268 [Mollisia scopiformis]